MGKPAGKGGARMIDLKNPERNIIAGRNLKKLVKQNPAIRTQERFAEFVDKDVKTVRRWFNQGIDSLSLIKTISDLLGISDTELLFEQDKQVP